MTQWEGIMQDVYTLAGTDQCQFPKYGPYYRYVNLYTRIRAARPSTCNVVRNAFGHLIIEHLIISKPMDGWDSYMV